MMPGEDCDSVVLDLCRLSDSSGSRRRVQSVLGVSAAVVASGSQLDIRIEKSGVESRLSRTGPIGQLVTKSGPRNSGKRIVTRDGEAEGMAGTCRSSRCVDDFDW